MCVWNRDTDCITDQSSIYQEHHCTSGTGLHSVTQGDTWRGSPLPVAYSGDHHPVTVCHSSFVLCHAPTLAGWERRGGLSATLTDWQVTVEASQAASVTDTQAFIHIPVWFNICVNACMHTNTAALFNSNVGDFHLRYYKLPLGLKWYPFRTS